MTFRELTVHRADGTARVVATERNDPEGRRAIELAAFRALEGAGVAYCSSQVVDRHTKRKGSVR